MSSNLPVIITDRNELDALCRAWLGYDSGKVEWLQRENERLQAVANAARAFAADETFYTYNVPTQRLYDDLKAKLAAYEGALEPPE